MHKLNTTVWGLDFGTTTTFLSESDITGSRRYSLREAQGLNEYVPSIVAVTEDGFVVGAAAESYPEEEILRSVKRAITLSAETIEMPRIPTTHDSSKSVQVNVDDAIRALLRKVHAIARRDIGDTPVRLGCPAMWNADQRQRLLRLANEAGFQIQFDTLIDEPVAACIGWFENQLRQNRRPTGTTLVFDMGGGTLDVAALKINSDHDSPEIYVLASDGIDEAGDALDESIAQLLLDKETKGTAAHRDLVSNPGWLRRAARTLKVQLGSEISTATTLRLPNGNVIELELTLDELRSAFEDQFRNALELIVRVLKVAKTTEWRNEAMSPADLGRLDAKELMSEVNHFLLVGGMSQMPLLRKLLIEAGIPPTSIYGSETTDPESAVSQGLALDRDYEHLSLDRPGFNFELRWSENGETQSQTVYEAYSRLYSRQQVMEGLPMKLTWRNETLERSRSDDETAVFCARTTGGEYIELSYEGELKQGFGLSYRLGLENRPVIIIQPNGRIFLRDSTGAELAIKVARWPVINAARNRTLAVKRAEGSGDHLSGLAWHERPSD